MDKKVIIFFIFLSFPQWAPAHKKFTSAPASYIDLSAEDKISFLGYGSYGASSDAEARSSVMPRCDVEKQKEYVKCAGGDYLKLLSSQNVKSLSYNIKMAKYHTVNDNIFNEVQKKIFERSILEYTANSGSTEEIRVPYCLEDNDEAKQALRLANDVTSKNPRSDAYNFLKNPTFENLEKIPPNTPDRNFVNRLQGIYNNTDYASVIKALVLGEQIKSRHSNIYQTTKTTGKLWWKKEFRYTHYKSKFGSTKCQGKCLIDQKNFYELKNHHPEIYNGQASKEANKLKEHLNSIINIEEFSGNYSKGRVYKPKPNPLDGLIKREYLKDNPLPKIQEHILKAKSLAENPPASPTPTQIKLIKAYQGMMLQLDRIRTVRNQDIKKDIFEICNLKQKAKNLNPKINYLIENHPLEFQQAMLDMKDESKKAAVNLYLCARAQGNDPKLTFRECASHLKLSSDEIMVTGKKIAMPNTNIGSDMGYNIKKGAPPKITTTIQLKKGPSLSDEEFETFKQQRTKEINNYFNCQAGAIESYKNENQEEVECPRHDPAKAKFDIKFIEGEGQIKFNVHKCFRGSAKKQLCDGEIKDLSIKSCKSKMTNRQTGLRLSDLFPDRSQIELRKKRPQSTYLRYALDCTEEASDLPRCRGKAGCELQTCTALACAIAPPEKDACLSQPIIDMLCERRSRSPEELSQNPYPLSELPKSPENDSPRWNRANSRNLISTAAPRVFHHELTHRLGVDDEYYDNEIYPNPNYGEKGTSLMNGGQELFPRHFKTMLKPLRCLDPGAI